MLQSIGESGAYAPLASSSSAAGVRIRAVDSSFFREWGSRYRVYAIHLSGILSSDGSHLDSSSHRRRCPRSGSGSTNDSDGGTVKALQRRECTWTVRKTLAQLRALRRKLVSTAAVDLPKLPGVAIVRRWASDRSMIIAHFLREAIAACADHPALQAFLEISALSFDAELGPKIKEGYLVKAPGGYATYYRSVRVYGLIQLVLVVGMLYSVVFLSDLHVFDTWASRGAYIAGAVLICLTWLRHWSVFRIIDALMLIPCIVSVVGWIPMVVWLISVAFLPEWWGKRKRWFVLKPTYLAYYTTNACVDMKGILEFDVLDRIQLYKSSLRPRLTIITTFRTLSLKASSFRERDEWYDLIGGILSARQLSRWGVGAKLRTEDSDVWDYRPASDMVSPLTPDLPRRAYFSMKARDASRRSQRLNTHTPGRHKERKHASSPYQRTRSLDLENGREPLLTALSEEAAAAEGDRRWNNTFSSLSESLRDLSDAVRSDDDEQDFLQGVDTSFAPVRCATRAQWYVDGRALFRAVADAMKAATREIYIAGWFLSPEVYMMRPPPMETLQPLPFAGKAERAAGVVGIVSGGGAGAEFTSRPSSAFDGREDTYCRVRGMPDSRVQRDAAAGDVPTDASWPWMLYTTNQPEGSHRVACYEITVTPRTEHRPWSWIVRGWSVSLGKWVDLDRRKVVAFSRRTMRFSVSSEAMGGAFSSIRFEFAPPPHGIGVARDSTIKWELRIAGIRVYEARDPSTSAERLAKDAAAFEASSPLSDADRLDAIVRDAAHRGVRVHIMLYREPALLMPNNSQHAKEMLRGTKGPNGYPVQVLRHTAWKSELLGGGRV